MDVLGDLLARARARGALFAYMVARGPWGVSFNDNGPLAIHAVLQGEAYLRSDGSPECVRLPQGAIALVRGPGRYQLSSRPGTPVVDVGVAAERWQVSPRRYAIPGEGDEAKVLCGAYQFTGGICDSLLVALPPIATLQGEAVSSRSLRAALELLAAEVGTDQPGQQTVLDRILDLLLVYTLRAWFDMSDASRPGWYEALRDPQLGQAMGLLHEDPAHRWTVQELATRVGLSRAAFARRFATSVGVPPRQYLAAWRMELATQLLRDSDLPLAAVAHQVGYASEFALSAAFRRAFGIRPGAFRRQARSLSTDTTSGGPLVPERALTVLAT